ncbi:MAG: hypothetical protein ACK5OX_16000 [Desertimonas sp.]
MSEPDGGGLTGLDPDRVRELADAAQEAGRRAEVIAGEVGEIVVAGQLGDNAIAELCGEVDEELGLLAGVLDTAAEAMETGQADAAVASAIIASALWGSLRDGSGAGFDPSRDPAAVGSAAPMSHTLAAVVLADHLADTGGELRRDGLLELARDEDQPIEVRMAALAFALDPELWGEITHDGTPHANGPAATESELRSFAELSLALGVLAEHRDRWRRAGDDGDELTARDLATIIDDETGAYGDDERVAAERLIAHPDLWLADNVRDLTHTLVWRRVFSERPGLAERYNESLASDPTGLNELVWADDEQVAEWVQQSLLSAETPAEQMAVVATMARTRLLAPPAEGLERERAVLTAVSHLDPTPVSDVLVAGTHVVDGNYADAGLRVLTALAPSDPATGAQVLDDAVRHARTGTRAVNAQRDLLADLVEPVAYDEMVTVVTDEFGSHAGAVVERHLTELGFEPGDIVFTAEGDEHPTP